MINMPTPCLTALSTSSETTTYHHHHARLKVRLIHKLGIPVIGVVDSNHSPLGIDYVIPGNDDSSKAVALYARAVADAVLEGKANSTNELVQAIAAEGDEFVEVSESL